MSFRSTVLQIVSDVKDKIYHLLEKVVDLSANSLGYPDIMGMETIPLKYREQFTHALKYRLHKTMLPPNQPPKPTSFIEAIFGSAPYSMTIDKHEYTSLDEGYYNFYIEKFRNAYFLPDWLSEQLQVRFELTNPEVLELVREGVFISVLTYLTIVKFRTTLFWYLTINPYGRPWIYMVYLTDWIYDNLAGMVPCIVGVDPLPSIIIGVIGKVADSLNHLVFTMPFLPNEGVETAMKINGQVRPVILYHHLPYLWYKYPIPNELREFWYYERPDILQWMEKAYKNLTIEFRPDSIVLDSLTPLSKIDTHTNMSLFNEISTQTLCANILDSQDWSSFYIHKQEILINFLFDFLDKLSFLT